MQSIHATVAGSGLDVVSISPVFASTNRIIRSTFSPRTIHSFLHQHTQPRSKAQIRNAVIIVVAVVVVVKMCHGRNGDGNANDKKWETTAWMTRLETSASFFSGPCCWVLTLLLLLCYVVVFCICILGMLIWKLVIPLGRTLPS